MGKQFYWGVIIFSIVINVIMLNSTAKAYYGREYESILAYSGISIVSAIIAFFTYLQWRKLEYKD